MLKVPPERLDAVFAALTHPTRRAIIERLAEGDCTVKELAEPHDVSMPAISQHLRVLEEAGLLEQTPEGRVRRCALNAAPLSSAFSWIVRYRLFWEDTLDSIARKVEGDQTTMTETKTTTKGRTLTISRVMKAPRERVYNAFLDPDAYAKWLPPHGYTGHVHSMEPREGGSFRMTFASLDKNDVHTFGGTYLELVPYERIVHTDKFETDHPDMQGEMRVTITFEEVDGGTRVTAVQENIPAFIPLEGSQVGWSQSLDNLARLVEL